MRSSQCCRSWIKLWRIVCRWKKRYQITCVLLVSVSGFCLPSVPSRKSMEGHTNVGPLATYGPADGRVHFRAQGLFECAVTSLGRLPADLLLLDLKFLFHV